MKIRYVIEHAEVTRGGVYLSESDDNGDTRGGFTHYPDEASAREVAEQSARLDGVTLTWKRPPKEWEPDAIRVSQFFQVET